MPVANRVAGGKRPRSSMSPSMVFDGQGRLVAIAGSPGGSRIIGYVAQALVAMLDWNMDAADGGGAAPCRPVQRAGGAGGEHGRGPAGADAAGPRSAGTGAGDAIGAEPHPRAAGLGGGADPRREGVVLAE